MTNEEREDAIRFFEWVMEDKPMKYSELAIEALKANGTDINVGSTDAISRQAAIDAISAAQAGLHNAYAVGLIRAKKMLIRAKKIISELPSAQPERLTGYWIEIDDNLIRGRCSECGWEAHLYEDDVVGMNYCPECGAKMEGVHDGSD